VKYELTPIFLKDFVGVPGLAVSDPLAGGDPAKVRTIRAPKLAPLPLRSAAAPLAMLRISLGGEEIGIDSVSPCL
jgi:hypothetical protein